MRGRQLIPLRTVVGKVDPDIPVARIVGPLVVHRVQHRSIVHRQVDEAGLGIEGHGMPVVRAVDGWRDARRAAHLTGLWNLDRTAGLVEPGRPRDLGEGGAGDVLSRLSIQDVEEAVFRRLHDDLAVAAFDLQVGQHKGLRGRVVPVVARRGLEVPDELSVVGAESEDGG